MRAGGEFRVPTYGTPKENFVQRIAFDAAELPGVDRTREEAWIDTLASSRLSVTR